MALWNIRVVVVETVYDKAALSSGRDGQNTADSQLPRPIIMFTNKGIERLLPLPPCLHPIAVAV